MKPVNVAEQVARARTLPLANRLQIVRDIESRSDDSLASVYGRDNVAAIREVAARVKKMTEGENG